MRVWGLTTEQTIDASHVAGLVGAAAILFVSVLTGIMASLHIHFPWWTLPDSVVTSWSPPDILIFLCIGLITGATINEFVNLTKPEMRGITSTTTSATQTSSTSSVPPNITPKTGL